MATEDISEVVTLRINKVLLASIRKYAKDEDRTYMDMIRRMLSLEIRRRDAEALKKEEDLAFDKDRNK